MRGILAALGLLLLLAVALWYFFICMPRTEGPAALQAPERTRSARLRSDVMMLASSIGERNVFEREGLVAAETFLTRSLTDAGYRVAKQEFHVELEQIRCANLEVEIPGSSLPSEIIIVGAHYDSVDGSPGGNDNGSGVAAVLELARDLASIKPARTIRFVFFVNEEPPFFQTENMGSWRYAKRAHERGEKIAAMLSIETVGFFSDEEGSQQYPAPLNLFYPSRGNFIGFVANPSSRKLLHRVIRTFRGHSFVPAEGAAVPDLLPGVGWSDHWSFWQFGYPAVMVTDTALFRDPHYHTSNDSPERLDYARLAGVVDGLREVIRDLASIE